MNAITSQARAGQTALRSEAAPVKIEKCTCGAALVILISGVVTCTASARKYQVRYGIALQVAQGGAS